MRPHRWIVAVASLLVPRASRQEWRAEWDAELHEREATRQKWSRTRGRRLELLRQTSGAFWDALWLRSSRWYALRLFGRHWRLAAAAVLSLAVAIAATTIGLSAYNALMLRPPNVTSPGTLRFIHIRTPEDRFDAASFPEYIAYRDRDHGVLGHRRVSVCDLEYRVQGGRSRAAGDRRADLRQLFRGARHRAACRHAVRCGRHWTASSSTS